MPDGGFSKLFAEVIDANRCTGCSACVVACPYHLLDYVNEIPKMRTPGWQDRCIKGEAHGCTVCSDVCPQIYRKEIVEERLFGRARREDEPSGIYLSILAARSTKEEVLRVAQDGGVMTTILLWGLEKGHFDGVLTSEVHPRNPWVAMPVLVTSKEQLLNTPGSRYTYSPNLLAMNEALLKDLQRIAVLGNPCQASGARYLELFGPQLYRERIALILTFFCTETFVPNALLQEKIRLGLDVRLEDVVKMDVKKRFLVRLKSGEVKEFPIKEIKEATSRPACRACDDFSGEFADIAVGALGGTDGWNVLLVRTKRGQEILKQVQEDGYLRVRGVEGEEFAERLKTLRRLSVIQRRRVMGQGH